MLKKYICGGEKYGLAGQTGDSICLPVSLENFPESVKIEGLTLYRRTSFHVTLVAIGEIIRKHKVLVPNFIDTIVADFCEFVKEYDVDFLRLTNEFRFTTHNERRSVVAMCEVSNLNKFFDLTNQKYGLNLEYPPTHVTLYTLQPDVGIFLTDSDDIKNLTKIIPFKLF